MTNSASIPLYLVTSDDLESLEPNHRIWLESNGFEADADSFCLLPGADGTIDRVLVGYSGEVTTWTLGAVASKLPPNAYHLADEWSVEESTNLHLGWNLGQYRFAQYKKSKKKYASLTSVSEELASSVSASFNATRLVRDLINTPANDLGPSQLQAEAQKLADQYQAQLIIIEGEDLLAQNYPMIHAVGRASDDAPRLIDMRWGKDTDPKVTLVGKGVCFDSGGLDLKSAGGMKKMKKDMGGAAHVLGVASMVMELKMPVCLRVLIPAVENSVSGNAMRPLDILPSRKGLTVEVGNTDAEGRLVLGDALTEASSEEPGLLIDFATLTGAARVALGTELPALFCNRSDILSGVLESGVTHHDPLWNLPLHKPYRSLLDSSIADLSNISSGSFGGAITAALFLQEFIEPDIPWVHIDVMAWNLRSLRGRPEGGEAMGMRAIAHFIQSFFSK